jgi:uncharacterized protein (DUF2252 family)
MKKNIVERIERFNAGRIPERLTLKYQLMRSDSFAFYRGTCHLFYEDWPHDSALDDAPPAWICGDLHLQNFGSYRGDDRLVYFDLNDFDEACLAPCTWELGRLLTSIFVAGRWLKLSDAEATSLSECLLQAYTDALSRGKSFTVEAETAEGMVQELLDRVAARKHKDLLDKRTEKRNGKRKLVIDNKRSAPVTAEERQRVEKFIEAWAARQPEPGFFTLLDVAHRIAGVGSLGVDRSVLLVEGKGSPDRNYLLDLKEELPSSLQPYLKLKQPAWKHEAGRVVTIQERAQGTSPALLTAVEMAGRSYVLKELQPTQDKIDLTEWNDKLHRLEKVVATMGRVTAWAQLRSSGRQGSAIADDLIAFANAPKWPSELQKYAKSYASQVEEDYRGFCSGSRA